MRIVYKNTDDTVSIVIPTEEALNFATIQQIAEKDVPKDLPYWIVEASNILEDRTNRNAWIIGSNFGKPDGFGGESNEFDDELLAKYLQGTQNV